MADVESLQVLARALGVHTHYTDGLGREVIVSPETLLRVCAVAGAPIAGAGDAAEALLAHQDAAAREVVPPVVVAWDGILAPLTLPDSGPRHAELCLADGEVIPLERSGARLQASRSLPLGYHRLTLEHRGSSTRAP